jgi:hypothetical protein
VAASCNDACGVPCNPQDADPCGCGPDLVCALVPNTPDDQNDYVCRPA